MLIDATLPLSFKSGGVALGIECTPSWPSPFPSCQLVHQDVLGTETLFLAWVDTTPDIEISRGHLEVIGLTDQIAYHLDLPQGSFPSSLKNRFLSFNQIPRSDAIWSGCVLKISIEFERPLASETKPYVEAFAVHMYSQVPNDVCFYFPRTCQSLWGNESILNKASPYLTSLLTSGFTESSPTSDVESSSSKIPTIAPFDFEDSDEETDKSLSRDQAESSATSVTTKFKRVDVVQATYTTYSNVLCWIGSGHISFAPLKSTKPSGFPKIRSPSYKSRFPLPTPASPKSIFRLAHLLEIPELVDLSLANFKFQLTVQNVAFELYTDIASGYPQVREIAMECAVENWRHVVKSEAYLEVEKRAERGEGIDAWTSLVLNKKLMERWAK